MLSWLNGKSFGAVRCGAIFMFSLQEAMLEVDADGSDDIDFFKYLSGANIYVNENGGHIFS